MAKKRVVVEDPAIVAVTARLQAKKIELADAALVKEEASVRYATAVRAVTDEQAVLMEAIMAAAAANGIDLGSERWNFDLPTMTFTRQARG